MKIKISVNSKLNKGEVLNKLKKVLFNSMLKMHELAVTYVPVDTGRLRNSLNIFPFSPGFSKYEFAAGTDYAPHVEFGTIKTHAQPFMRPAFIQVKNIWVKRFLNKEFAK